MKGKSRAVLAAGCGIIFSLSVPTSHLDRLQTMATSGPAGAQLGRVRPPAAERQDLRVGLTNPLAARLRSGFGTFHSLGVAMSSVRRFAVWLSHRLGCCS